MSAKGLSGWVQKITIYLTVFILKQWVGGWVRKNPKICRRNIEMVHYHTILLRRFRVCERGGGSYLLYIEFFFHKKANVLSKMFITDNYYVRTYLLSTYLLSLYQWQKKIFEGQISSEFGRCSLIFGSNFCQKNDNCEWHSNQNKLSIFGFFDKKQAKIRPNIQKILDTVFPRIVSAETILF